LDEWLGIQKYERRSPLVDVKIAELASKCDYRVCAKIFPGWLKIQYLRRSNFVHYNQ